MPQTRWAKSAVIAVAEVLLCSSLPTQLLIGQMLAAAGLDPPDGRAGQLSLPFAFALSLIDTVVLIALMVVLTRAHGESPSRAVAGRSTDAARGGVWAGARAARLPDGRIADDRADAPAARPSQRRGRIRSSSSPPAARSGARCSAWWRSSPAACAKNCSARFSSAASSSTSAAPIVGVIVLSVAFGLGH